MELAGIHESLLRLGSFFAVFGAMALWEALAPRRRPEFNRRQRWPHNLALLLIDIAVIRIIAPGAAIAVAIAGEANGWGLLNSIATSHWLAIPAAVVFLDLVIYFQHVTFHAGARVLASIAYRHAGYWTWMQRDSDSRPSGDCLPVHNSRCACRGGDRCPWQPCLRSC